MLRRAFSAAKARAIARPRPLLAPLIITTLPSSCRSIFLLERNAGALHPQSLTANPSLQQTMEMADLGFLVVGQGHRFLLHRHQAALHFGKVEGVLVEDSRKKAQLRRLRPVIVGSKPVNLRGGRPRSRGVRRQIHAFHYRLIDPGSVRPEPIDDPVVGAPGMKIREYRV